MWDGVSLCTNSDVWTHVRACVCVGVAEREREETHEHVWVCAHACECDENEQRLHLPVRLIAWTHNTCPSFYFHFLSPLFSFGPKQERRKKKKSWRRKKIFLGCSSSFSRTVIPRSRAANLRMSGVILLQSWVIYFCWHKITWRIYFCLSHSLLWLGWSLSQSIDARRINRLS